MKKFIIVVLSLMLVLLLTCCDADQLVKTGKNLQDMGRMGYASEIYNENLKTQIKDIIDDVPTEGENLNSDDTEKLATAVVQAYEAGVPATEIRKLLDKSNGQRTPGDAPQIATQMTAVVESTSENFEEEMRALCNSVGYMISDEELAKYKKMDQTTRKIVKTINSIAPAVNALQSILNQAYDRSYQSYSDLLAVSMMYSVCSETVRKFADFDSVSVNDLITTVGDNVLVYFQVLEVLYGVNFDIEAIVDNFASVK